jgi:hypothetical protein
LTGPFSNDCGRTFKYARFPALHRIGGLMHLQMLRFIMAAALAAASSSVYAAPALKARTLSIGKNLQMWSSVALSEPAPADLQLTLTSSDPSRLVLAKTPEVAGTASITLTVKTRFRESPEFWLQALSDEGDVQFTATAAGYETSAGTVKLSPSGIVITGPMGEISAPEFTTTPRGWPSKISLQAVRLNESLQKAEPQYVRGGLTVEVVVESSYRATGEVNPSVLKIPPATHMASAVFQPAGLGKTVLSVKPPSGFRVPAALHSLTATVKTPGMAVANDVVVGENLQLAVAFAVGEPAPPEGLTARLTSDDPERLLLSTSPTEPGKPAIDIRLPGGAVSTTYYVQALSRSGTATHKAVATGYSPRTGTVVFAPSGVILSLEKHGPPDEAEVFRPDTAGSHRNLFVALLSDTAEHPLIVYTAYLDPKSRRSADITVQQLRAGLSLNVGLKNSNPAIAAIDTTTVIKGGSDRALIPFKPVSKGESIISVETPAGFTTPSNATELQVIVRD